MGVKSPAYPTMDEARRRLKRDRAILHRSIGIILAISGLALILMGALR